MKESTVDNADTCRVAVWECCRTVSQSLLLRYAGNVASLHLAKKSSKQGFDQNRPMFSDGNSGIPKLGNAEVRASLPVVCDLPTPFKTIIINRTIIGDFSHIKAPAALPSRLQSVSLSSTALSSLMLLMACGW